jgi:glycosyltransferase 2 family protein
LKKPVLSILKYGLFIGLGVSLVWIAIVQLSPEERENSLKAIRNANYFWVVISMLAGVIAHWSRAVRWKMLMEPLGHKPTVTNVFFAVCSGYLANYAIPRLGEVARCTLLTKYEKIPLTESFGTVIAERIVDMITMLLVFFFTLAIQFEDIYGQVDKWIFTPAMSIASKLMANKVMLVIAIAICVAVAGAFFLFRKKIKGLLSEKVQNLLKGFLEGFRSIRKVRNPWSFVFHSLLIWTMYYAMVHFVFYSFGETSHLGLKAGLAVLMFGSIGVMLTPGGLGIYPIMVGSVLLTMFAIPKELGQAFGWVAWSSQFILILILGAISLSMFPVLNKDRQVKNASA